MAQREGRRAEAPFERTSFLPLLSKYTRLLLLTVKYYSVRRDTLCSPSRLLARSFTWLPTLTRTSSASSFLEWFGVTLTAGSLALGLSILGTYKQPEHTGRRHTQKKRGGRKRRDTKFAHVTTPHWHPLTPCAVTHFYLVAAPRIRWRQVSRAVWGGEGEAAKSDSASAMMRPPLTSRQTALVACALL